MDRYFYISPISLAEPVVKEGKPVKRCTGQLLPIGRSFNHPSGPGGKLNFNEKLLDQLVSNFNAGAAGRVLPVSDDGKHVHPDDHSKAWLTGLEKVGDGVEAMIELCNPTLAERVENKEVRFLSAEIDFAYKDAETGKVGPHVLGASFTSRPYIKNMRPVQILNFSELQEWSKNLPDNDEDRTVVLSEQVATLTEQLAAKKTSEDELKTKVTQLSEAVESMHQVNLELSQSAIAQKDEALLEKFVGKVPPACLARLSSLMAMDRGETVALSEVIKKDATTLVSLSDMTRAASPRDLAILLCEEIAALPLAVKFSEDQVKLAERRGSGESDNARAIVTKAREYQEKGIAPQAAYLKASQELGGN